MVTEGNIHCKFTLSQALDFVFLIVPHLHLSGVPTTMTLVIHSVLIIISILWMRKATLQLRKSFVLGCTAGCWQDQSPHLLFCEARLPLLNRGS